MTRRQTVPLLVALACALGVLVTGVLAVEVPFVHARDAAALHGFMGLDRPGVHGLFDRLVMAMDPASYTLLGLALVVAAVVAGRPARALTVVVLLVGTGATTARSAGGATRTAQRARVIAAVEWPLGNACGPTCP